MSLRFHLFTDHVKLLLNFSATDIENFRTALTCSSVSGRLRFTWYESCLRQREATTNGGKANQFQTCARTGMGRIAVTTSNQSFVIAHAWEITNRRFLFTCLALIIYRYSFIYCTIWILIRTVPMEQESRSRQVNQNPVLAIPLAALQRWARCIGK